MKIEKVETFKTRGTTPNKEQIQKFLKNQQEEGLEPAEIKLESFFDKHNGMKEYLVMIFLKETEDKPDYIDDGEWITEELADEEEFNIEDL